MFQKMLLASVLLLPLLSSLLSNKPASALANDQRHTVVLAWLFNPIERFLFSFSVLVLFIPSWVTEI